ncbi:MULTISPECIES: alpha-1,2-fucosyltransferase [Hymenobacter]|uniref:alpha-1,2-fucosyltransferase n=1 Tax=Hymenobacter TaxID=89966 RepID=UPI001CF228E1|nr:alpha-1,2-fucosyltransferase [Hymenobacter pini]MCA8833418.1 alpha-1,2-fucosyltransferase [Hymenobacter pini]
MIKVKLLGRLGNQLFQFAFASLLAKRLGTHFLLDTNDQPFDLPYFELHGAWPLLQRRSVWKVYNKLQQAFLRKAPFVDLRDCRVPLDESRLRDEAVYWGYFQEYQLYEPIKADLLRWFTVLPKYRQTFETKYAPKLRQRPSVVASFRLGDYQSFDVFAKDGQPPILPLEWQRDILLTFDFEQFNLFIISDDIQQVEQRLQLQHPNLEYVRADVPTQLLLLQHADYGIISNSTFAWWGAYLNTTAQKIYCPQYFLGFHFGIEYPVNIYPPHWTQVPVSTQAAVL